MADLNQVFNEFNDTADSTNEFSPDDIKENKIMAILAYISWLVVIPIFAAKESKFARFHANQGLLLAIVEIIFWIVCGILDGLPIIGWVFSLVNWLINVVCLIFAIIGIINAVNGRAKELPLIGMIRILK